MQPGLGPPGSHVAQQASAAAHQVIAQYTTGHCCVTAKTAPLGFLSCSQFVMCEYLICISACVCVCACACVFVGGSRLASLCV